MLHLYLKTDMKKIIILILIVSPLFMAFQCEPPEPCSPSILQKNKPNLINIENLQTSYNLGDIIWLNSNLDRNQVFENSTETIDLFNYPLDYAYSIQFNKSSVYNPSIYLCVDENTSEITNGSIKNCNLLVYEKVGDVLKSRVGIKLLETGSYELSVYNISTFRETGLTCGDTALDIHTTFNNNQQLITFTVQ